MPRRLSAFTVARRGIAHRPGRSVLVVAVAALAVAAATATLAYQRAAHVSLLADALRNAPAYATQVSLTASGSADGTPSATDAEATLLASMPEPVRRLFELPVGAESTEVGLPYRDGSAIVPLTYRDRVCGHLAVTGACPAGPGEVLLSSRSAARIGVAAGGRLRLGRRDLAVVGTYTPRDPAEPYWGGVPYFGDGPDPAGVRLDAVFTGAAADVRAGGAVTTRVDLVLRPGAVHLDDLDGLRAAVARLAGAARPAGFTVATGLPDVLAGATRDGRTLDRTLAAVGLPLVLLGLGVLAALAGAVATERAPEIALAGLRGFPPGRAARHAGLETLLLIAVATPLGAALGLAVTAGVAALALADGVRVELRWPVLAAALGTAALAALATRVVAGRLLRRPLPDLLRRAPGRPARGLEVAALIAAVAAVAATIAVAAATGPTGTGSVGRGSVGRSSGIVGSAGTGSAGTGSAGTGSAGTGSGGIGSAGTGSGGTGSAGTGSGGTGSGGTGSGGIGSGGTGSGGTGSGGTGSGGTGSGGTGSGGSGSVDAGSAGAGLTPAGDPIAAGPAWLAGTRAAWTAGSPAAWLLTPALALLCGLAAARLLAAAGRLAVRRARQRGHVVGLIAGARLARRARPVSTAVTSVAVALLVFGTLAWVAGAAERADRADDAVGADRVYTVTAPYPAALVAAVEAADPGGHAMAVARTTQRYAGTDIDVIGVDAARLPAVARWRGEPAEAVAAMARALTPAVAPALRTDGRVTVTVVVSAATPDGVDLGALLAVPGGAPVAVRLGRLADGTRTFTATRALAACVAGCRLTGLTLAPRHPGAGPAHADVLIARVLGADAPGPWRAESDGIAVTGTRIVYDTDDLGQQIARYVDAPDPLPAVLAGAAPAGDPGAGRFSFPGLRGSVQDFAVVGRAARVPRAAGRALLCDLADAVRAAELAGDAADGGLRYEVWATAAAPADLVARLAERGVTVLATQTRAGYLDSLDRAASALGLAFHLGAGAVALLYALTLSALDPLFGAPGRDTGPLAFAGVRQRDVRRSLVVGAVAAAGVAWLVGAAVGVACAIALAGAG